MGLFDYIRCEAPLPNTPIPPPDVFQTKDTPDQYMSLYTITAEGKLIWRPYTIEVVPDEERPYPDMPFLRRVEQEPEDINFHGDICFYTSDNNNRGWWEYVARFTDGQLSRITLVEYRDPAGEAV